MNFQRKWILVLATTALVFAPLGIGRADDDDAAPPKVEKPLIGETIAPCFVPAGAPAPESYLKKSLPGWDHISGTFHLKMVRVSGDVGALLSHKSIEMILETFFQEPALEAAEREKKKETAANKDNAWKLPLGAQTWADIKPQYIFYLKTQTLDSKCGGPEGPEFHIRYSKNGKEIEKVPSSVVWKHAKADFNTVLGYSNEGFLYSGVPLSEAIDTFTVEAVNCFGQKMIYTYHFKYGIVPKYVESRDGFSGAYQGKLVWPDKAPEK